MYIKLVKRANEKIIKTINRGIEDQVIEKARFNQETLNVLKTSQETKKI
jgi:hypothetical protein